MVVEWAVLWRPSHCDRNEGGNPWLIHVVAGGDDPEAGWGARVIFG